MVLGIKQGPEQAKHELSTLGYISLNHHQQQTFFCFALFGDHSW